MQIMCDGELVTLERPVIAEPTQCPICGAATSRALRGKESAMTFCTNLECSGKTTGKIKSYIKKTEIMGVGDAVLEALVDSELVKTPADLYKLTAEQIENLTIGENKSGKPIRLGNSRAIDLVKEIEKAKTLTLPKFLGSLGIDLLGRRRVEIIAQEQGLTTLQDWMDESKLKTIPGDVLRSTITEGLTKAIPVIGALLSVGVQVMPMVVQEEIQVDTNIESDGPKQIAGSSFCWTGCRDYIDEVKAKGGIIKSGVSKGLNYLVQHDATSSSGKTMKAESYGTKIISIDTLRAVLDGLRDLP